MASMKSYLFHASTALSLISYYQAIVTNPGTVPRTPEWTKNGDARPEGKGQR